MFERRRVGQELKWIDASPPAPHKLIGARANAAWLCSRGPPRHFALFSGPANADPDGLLWFVSSTGDLLECKRKPSRPKVRAFSSNYMQSAFLLVSICARCAKVG